MGRVSGTSPLKNPDGSQRLTALVGRTLTRTMRRWGQGGEPSLQQWVGGWGRAAGQGNSSRSILREELPRMPELSVGGRCRSTVQSPRSGHRLAACGEGGALATGTTRILTLTTTGVSRCRCPALCLSTPRNPAK